jgi:DNA (cytosine-5)-methyltransferase 1
VPTEEINGDEENQDHSSNVDVRTCDIAIISEIKVKLKKGSQIVVFGGLPCQDFSTSNQRTRSKKNPINWLFSMFAHALNKRERVTNPPS